MRKNIAERQSNFELCRICTMVFITLNHMELFYSLFSNLEPYSINEAINCLFYCGGKFGCNVFLILSVYFLSQSKFKISRVIKIAAQTMFYLILLNIVSAIIGFEPFSLSSITKNIHSTVTGETYWYSFSYVALLLISPLLNSFLDAIKYKRFFLIVFGLVIVIIPSVSAEYALFGYTGRVIFGFLNLKYVLLFSFEYCVMYWYQHYFNKKLKLRKNGWKIFLISYFIMFLMTYAFKKSSIGFFSGNYGFLRNMNSILCIISALGFFLMFSNFEIPSSKFINGVSKTMYGVFLVQVHPTFRRLWCQLDFVQQSYQKSVIGFIMMSLLITAIIFAIAFLIEAVRIPLEKAVFRSRIVEKTVLFMQKLCEGIYGTFDKLIKLLSQKKLI